MKLMTLIKIYKNVVTIIGRRSIQTHFKRNPLEAWTIQPHNNVFTFVHTPKYLKVTVTVSSIARAFLSLRYPDSPLRESLFKIPIPYIQGALRTYLSVPSPWSFPISFFNPFFFNIYATIVWDIIQTEFINNGHGYVLQKKRYFIVCLRLLTVVSFCGWARVFCVK